MEKTNFSAKADDLVAQAEKKLKGKTPKLQSKPLPYRWLFQELYFCQVRQVG